MHAIGRLTKEQILNLLKKFVEGEQKEAIAFADVDAHISGYHTGKADAYEHCRKMIEENL